MSPQRAIKDRTTPPPHTHTHTHSHTNSHINTLTHTHTHTPASSLPHPGCRVGCIPSPLPIWTNHHHPLIWTTTSVHSDQRFFPPIDDLSTKHLQIPNLLSLSLRQSPKPICLYVILFIYCGKQGLMAMLCPIPADFSSCLFQIGTIHLLCPINDISLLFPYL